MSKQSLSAPLGPRVSLTRPLRHARYRQLWLANLISNLGTWTQTFASAWLLATVSTSAATSSLVQTATYVPIFLFALLAGVVADGVNRPKFLFLCNLFMALSACAMAALVMTGHTAAGPVLALTFCLGSGAAFMWLSLASVNVGPGRAGRGGSRRHPEQSVLQRGRHCLGPALGGLLFAWVGACALFLVNAASFIGLLGVYWFWWQEQGQNPPVPAIALPAA
ncbi:MFS transporter [Massilia sp. H-1]|nr:MFS transporter [Massilia sp. H-1]